MATLKQQLKDARSRFDTSIEAGQQAFGAAHPFCDIVRQEGLETFQNTLQARFAADFSAIVQSAGGAIERLKRCAELFATHKATYESIFRDSANREICMKASVRSLRAAFQTILKA